MIALRSAAVRQDVHLNEGEKMDAIRADASSLVQHRTHAVRIRAPVVSDRAELHKGSVSSNACQIPAFAHHCLCNRDLKALRCRFWNNAS
jgi:hypothetical protein